MEHPLHHWLLASDVDGTLIDSDGNIPRRNLEAIERFQQQGGTFMLATGRGIESSRRYARAIPGCRYAILFNGSLIYDFEEEKTLYAGRLPREAFDLAQHIHNRFDTLCVEVYTEEGIFCSRHNPYSTQHFDYEALSYHVCGLDNLPREGWIKAVFVDDPERMKGVRPVIRQLLTFPAGLVMSDRPYYELLPDGHTKGRAFRQMAEILSIPLDRTAAIGDYYNDRELLSTAAVSAVPEKAPDELKGLADLVCGKCEDGAVADLIAYLESAGKA